MALGHALDGRQPRGRHSYPCTGSRPLGLPQVLPIRQTPACGQLNSVIGMDKQVPIERFIAADRAPGGGSGTCHTAAYSSRPMIEPAGSEGGPYGLVVAGTAACVSSGSGVLPATRLRLLAFHANTFMGKPRKVLQRSGGEALRH